MTAPRAIADSDLDAIVGIVGAEHVREPAPGEAVGEVRPRAVVLPADEAEVAAVLIEASARGLAVTPSGTGTKLGWGLAPERCDIVLSTRRLRAVVEHQPGDLVCVAQAGITLDELQTALAGAVGYTQALMLDPPQGGTLGGVLAAAASGPLRTRYGTPRDLVIGTRFVLADGTIGHSGGKVVKNVAGYDVSKLLIGSLGTLAVITQVALRLHPVPPASHTVLVAGGSAAELEVFAARLRRLPVTPSTVDVFWPDRLAVVRIDSSEEGARHQAELVAHAGGGRVLEADAAVELDARLRERPWTGQGAIAALSVPRSRLEALLRLCDEHADEVVVRVALGTAEARVADEPQRLVALRAAAERLGGHMVLRRCGAATRALTWPPADAVGGELMRSVKVALDPARLLSPGRHVGGI